MQIIRYLEEIFHKEIRNLGIMISLAFHYVRFDKKSTK